MNGNTQHATGRTDGWGFWGRWAVATLLALAVGAVLFLVVVQAVFALEAVSGLAETDDRRQLAFAAVVATTLGLAVGVAQAWALQGRLPGPAWVGATVLGFLAGVTVLAVVMDGASRDDLTLIDRLGHGLVVGGALGLSQWPTLRRRVAGAGRWVAVSTAAWVAAEILATPLIVLVGPPADLLGVFAVSGLLSGAGMAWLLGRAARASVPAAAALGAA